MHNEHSIPDNPGRDNVGEPMFHDPAFDDPDLGDVVLSSLERELKGSAERLGGLSPNRTFAQLSAEAVRRRRLGVTRQASVSGVVGVALLIGWLGANWVGTGHWSRSDSSQPPIAHVDLKTEQSISQSPILVKTNIAAHSHLAARPTDTAGTLSNADHETQPSEQYQKLAAADKVGLPVPISEPVPVLVHMTQSDGKIIVAPGIIVPEHTERLDWSQLGPEERRAVWQVLNLESEKPAPERPTI
jgi:hypothetical protein